MQTFGNPDCEFAFLHYLQHFGEAMVVLTLKAIDSDSSQSSIFGSFEENLQKTLKTLRKVHLGLLRRRIENDKVDQVLFLR